MLAKLVRPEFQAFLEDEQSILTLVKDVADVLENMAANSTHTPALYAAFLRALISAKLAPQQQRLVDNRLKQDQSHDSGAILSLYETPSTADVGTSSSAIVRHQTTSISPSTLVDDGSSNMPLPAAPPPPPAAEESGTGGYFQHPYYMNEFQFESEMGPATDITTFPPTMAVPSQLPPHSGEEGEGGGMMAMENILSSGFWDNMVVPGAPLSLSLSSFPCR